MPTILLIRHGENDYVKKGRLAGRIPGVHLNQRGVEQAQELAEKLAGAPVRSIYSSPLERATETAEPIAQKLGLEVNICQGLIEVDVGDWHDQRIKSLSRSKPWRVIQTMPSRGSFPGGETVVEAQLRVCQAVEKIANNHDGKDLVICVSHGDPIRLAVAHFIGLPLDLFQRLHAAPASITALYIGEGNSRLLTLNYELSFSFPKN
jgi:probable phosphoglycerate mutase